MPRYDYGKLQNGSDIRGIALEGVEGEHVNLDTEAAGRIARGFLFWLHHTTGKEAAQLTVSIGRDPRLSGEAIVKAFCDALAPYGCKILDAGLASTPAMFMSTIFEEYQCDGAVMVTASHLPWNRNGMKFFSKEGGLNKGDIADIITFAESDSVLNSIRPGAPSEIKEIPLLDTYAAHLRKLITDGAAAGDTPLSGMKITVDAGNGSGGFYAEKVLAPLGADVSSSQFLEPDGHFPNHIPNPENKQAMESIRQAVLKNKADLGIIFDTDVDRMSAVLPNGDEVNRDAIIAMMTAIIAEDYPGGTIVTDSVTSDRLTRFIEGIGMKHHRYMRGYKNVINESIRLNNDGTVSPLAIETSGHGALSENYFLDDGAYMAVIALAKAAKQNKPLAAFIETLEKGFEEREYRFKIDSDNFKEYGQNALNTFEERAKAKGYQIAPNSYEGIRITFDTNEVKGWLLLRMSLHDPQMPLNIEGVREGDCDRLFDIVLELLKGFDKLVLPNR